MILEPFTGRAFGTIRLGDRSKINTSTHCDVRREGTDLHLSFMSPAGYGEVFWHSIEVYDASGAHILTVNIERWMSPGDRWDITIGVSS